MEFPRYEPMPNHPDSNSPLVKDTPSTGESVPKIVSLNYQYLFPSAVNDDGAGRVSLKWSPGEGPFDSKARQLVLNSALRGPYMLESAFTPAECDAVIQLGESIPAVRGTTVDGRSNYRVSDIHWIEPSDDAKWLYHRVATLILLANRNYEFDLAGFVESLQYASYGTNGHFEWHMDIGTEIMSARKLGLTLQLSDVGDYEGGDLEFFNAGKSANRRLPRGSVIVFPSYLMHRVAQVTRGIRRSLVAWAYGPGFR